MGIVAGFGGGVWVVHWRFHFAAWVGGEFDFVAGLVLICCELREKNFCDSFFLGALVGVAGARDWQLVRGSGRINADGRGQAEPLQFGGGSAALTPGRVHFSGQGNSQIESSMPMAAPRGLERRILSGDLREDQAPRVGLYYVRTDSDVVCWTSRSFCRILISSSVNLAS